MGLEFFVGLTEAAHAQHFESCLLGIQRLRRNNRLRSRPFQVKRWILDSRAHMELAMHGQFLRSAGQYAADANQLASNGELVAVVQQDWNCSPVAIAQTGKSVREHQLLTIENYCDLRDRCNSYVMPVLQGQTVDSYLECLELFGELLEVGQWVGVGALKQFGSNYQQIQHLLHSIHQNRPDLLLHGFGLTLKALKIREIWELAASADSNAWCFHARKNNKGTNDWRNAADYVAKVQKCGE